MINPGVKKLKESWKRKKGREREVEVEVKRSEVVQRRGDPYPLGCRISVFLLCSSSELLTVGLEEKRSTSLIILAMKRGLERRR